MTKPLFVSWNVEEYCRRIRLLRGLFGESQTEFAFRLGIPFKKWNHYERGYPLSRETAFILQQKVPGISTDWIWFGNEKGLSDTLQRRLEGLMREDAQRIKNEKALARASSHAREKMKAPVNRTGTPQRVK